jgi:DNA modification methylase
MNKRVSMAIENMEVNAIYEGDNLEIMSKFPDKSVDLIYADPPFFSNKHYEVIWKDKAEIRSFQDRWEGGIEHYITWMNPRLSECFRVLKNTGSMYLHCDTHANSHLRNSLDKIFGESNLRNEIIWHYRKWSTGNKQFQNNHDTIFFYSKTNDKKRVFNKMFMERAQSTLKRFGNARIISGYDEKTGKRVPAQMADEESEGVSMDDVWEIGRVPPIKQLFPTQKPMPLLERIIEASSNKGDIVLDPFCGCGTTLMASQKLGRKWIGIDISPTACKLMKERLRKDYAMNAMMVKGEVDLRYVKHLPPFEFQNWVVIDKFLGTVSRTKSGDMGVDGYTSQIDGGYPIQVKQTESIGRNPIDNFETAMRRTGKKKGYFVALSFGKGAYEEVARAKNEEGVNILLRTAQDLIDGKITE